MNKNYSVKLEIAGPSAIFVRPDSGDAPVSYPAPTASAVKGIFESVLRWESVKIVPQRVEICAPVLYHNYTTNYGGPLRKPGQLKEGNSYQLLATVLINVCYRLYALPTHAKAGEGISDLAKQEQAKTSNVLHAYQAVFEKRLKRGQCFSIPCLGWKEFVPDYLGEFREETKVCGEVNIHLPSMLQFTFAQGIEKKYAPTYRQNIHIDQGVLSYVE